MYQAVWQEILDSQSILLVSHVNPDGDSIGSTLALYQALKSLGKGVYLYNKSKSLPKKYEFLKNYSQISNHLTRKYDAVVTCDCATFERSGLPDCDFKVINIDHHITNQNFGTINLVDSNFLSTTLIIFELFNKNKIQISKDIATSLYLGVVEDTNFFIHGNINSDFFLHVSSLVSLGADTKLVSTRLKQSVSLAKFRLHQHAMNSVDLLKNGTVSRVIIWQDDLKRTGAKREDAEDIVNIICELTSVNMSILILEEESGEFKVSLRSKENTIDVSRIALQFNGGGHFNSAGFESNMADVNWLILKILDEYEKGII